MHTFEQIVSLYTYTVSNLYGESRDVDVFRQHLRFASAISKSFQSSVFNSGPEKEQNTQRKIDYILRFVDEGLKAFSILENVKTDDSLLDTFDVDRIERVMEENAIFFPKSHTRHPYPIQAMSTVLQNPLPILQSFLCILPAEELLPTVIKCHLGKMIDRDALLGKPKTNNSIFDIFLIPNKSHEPLSFNELLNSYNDNEVTLDILLKAYSEGKIRLDKAEFSVLIEKSITDVIQHWSTQVLSDIFSNHIDSSPMIESIVDKESFTKDGILKLNMKDLETLCLLGQSDQIGEMLSKRIKEQFISNKDQKELITSPEASELKQLAKWYRACKMGYVSEMSQIPSLIASILYNRIEHYAYFEYVTCSNHKLVEFSDKGKVESLQKLVTKVIEISLYRTSNYPSLPYQKNYGFNELIRTIDDFINDEKLETYQLDNNLMVEWTEYDKTRTRDRFKRPLKKFNDSIHCAKSKIEVQKQKGINHYFPVSNKLPLPFWAVK